MDIRFQKLLIYTATEQCRHRDIKFRAIHVVDQADQDFFCTAMAKIMDEKKNLFFHKLLLLIYPVSSHPAGVHNTVSSFLGDSLI